MLEARCGKMEVTVIPMITDYHLIEIIINKPDKPSYNEKPYLSIQLQ